MRANLGEFARVVLGGFLFGRGGLVALERGSRVRFFLLLYLFGRFL